MQAFANEHLTLFLFLAAVGAIALIGVIVSLFFAIGRRPEHMWTTEIGEVDSADFLRPLGRLLGVPVRAGGAAQLLNNGEEWMNALFADFRAASQSITFSVYIWTPGKLSDVMTEALVERARAGVQVRVLLDGVGGIRCPGETIDALRNAGARVEKFRPLKFGKLMRFHKRNHSRAIVIDGRIGYTGGMAVDDHWLGNARNPQEWRDTMVRVTGPLAEHLQSAFAGLWAYVTGEVLTGTAFFPEDVHEPSEVCSIGLASSPASEQHPLSLLFFLTFLAAREQLWITTPYFIPDSHTLKVLTARARAGVDVRMLLPNNHTDAKPLRLASHYYYQPLLEAGVRVFEYQATMIHSKHVVADGQWSIVGSPNMDIRSRELNRENVLGILDRKLASEVEAAFTCDQAQAREITCDEWKRRGLHARVLERCSIFLAEQY